MIDDFLINSWNEFVKQFSQDDFYEIASYVQDNIVLSIYIKHDSRMVDYIIPHSKVCVEMNENIFEKEIIEDFLNTIIRFFSGTHIRWYYIEYDSRFAIDSMNQWKKYSIEDIKSIDLTKWNDYKNKIFLDWILYLYYTLHKQILALGIAQKNIDIFLDEKDEMSHTYETMLMSKDRVTLTHESLFKNLKILHKQITILLWYFTHKH